ncbi:hypothetical protein J2W27_000330 [Variovorax boronicumulans]|uniref:hypothetical protein n=1 Tax=Variovorax boronicumulans TaxID=436515 RepID=UPI002785E21E|nr:hypothetical protein [Variovorax boronicumulans]MDP9908237.1 hypothetical protein [Variovorax boronicumulans]
MATKATGLGVWDLNAGGLDPYEGMMKPIEDSADLFKKYQGILDTAYRLDETANTQDSKVDALNAKNDIEAFDNTVKLESSKAGKEGLDALLRTPDVVDVVDDQGNVTGQRKLTEWERRDKARADNPNMSPWAQEKLQLDANKYALDEYQRTSMVDPISAMKLGVSRGFIPAGYEVLPAGTDRNGDQSFLMRTPGRSEPMTLNRAQMLTFVHDLGNKGKESLTQARNDLTADATRRRNAEVDAARIVAAREEARNRLLIAGVQADGRMSVAEVRTGNASGSGQGRAAIDPVTGQPSGRAANAPAPSISSAPSAVGASPYGAPSPGSFAASYGGAAAPAAPAAQAGRSASAETAPPAAPTADQGPKAVSQDPVQAEIDRIDALWHSAQSDGIDDREMQSAYLNRRNQLLLQQRGAASNAFQAERANAQQAWDAREQARVAAAQREEQQRALRREQAMRAFSGK